MSQLANVPRQLRIISDALRRRFEPYIDVSDVTNPDPSERRRALLTRALAAAVASDRAETDDAKAATMVTDGGQDFGIDAVAFTMTGPRLWLVQTKWSDKAEASFGEAEVRAMEDGLRMIDRREFDRFNRRFAAHVDSIRAILDQRQTQMTLVVGAMRQAPLHSNVVDRLGRLCREFNTHGEYLDWEMLDLRGIWDVIGRSGRPAPIDLSFELEQWFEIRYPMLAVNGITTAANVASWYEAKGVQMFRKNIRESLGITQVNADIERSLRDEPGEFWYRNNGITILCRQLKVTPKSRSRHGPADIDAADASVVNGAQTVAAVAAAVRAAADNDDVLLAPVGVRVIESADERASVQITKATNTQNRIEQRDFVALDPVQLAIRVDFEKSLGLAYAIRRSEFDPSPESGCTVREAAIALACAHPDPVLSLRVRGNEDLLWEEGTGGAYRRIFGEPPSAIQIWRSVLLMRRVRDSLHVLEKNLRGRAAAIVEQGSLVIAHIVFQNLGRDGIDELDYDWEPTLAQVPDVVTDTAHRLVAEIDRQFGETSFVASTLGSEGRIRPLIGAVLSAQETGEEVPQLGPGYIPMPRQKARRRNSVPVLIDAGRIKDGTPLSYRPSGEPERRALERWLAEDSRRGTVAWVNSRSKPLVWAADGRRYTPTGLVMRMYALAGWDDGPVAVPGPTRWFLADGDSLASLAKRILRESGSDEETAE